jgi:hypothetical protein
MDYTFDKRMIDSNGHMHVPNCRVTKASVDKYLGAETNGASLRGFSAFDMLSIYRDEQELIKSLSSFDTVPLMVQHVITTADDPQKDLLVGAATNPRWEAPYVIMDLTIWDQAGIDLIESKEQAELSAGYQRELDWTPGTSPNGLQYDARMFNIKCNHVALVRKGRVDGAIVADKAPEVSMFDKLKFPKIVAALFSALGVAPKAESALALDAALESEISVDEKKKHKKGSAASGEEAATVITNLDPDGDDDADMSEDEKASKAKLKKEAKEAAEKKAKEDEAVAMDAKINEAVAVAVTTAEARVHGLYAAKGAVEAIVGDVSLDSAEKVYRFALTKVGVEHEAVTVDALPALWESSQKPSNVSMDAARLEPFDIAALFPGIGLIRKG